MIYKNTSNQLMVAYNNGALWLTENSMPAYIYLANADLHIVDINGDGKGDITNTTTTEHDTYYSLGDLIVKGGSYTGSWATATANKVTYYRESHMKKNKVVYDESEDYNNSIDVNMAFIR